MKTSSKLRAAKPELRDTDAARKWARNDRMSDDERKKADTALHPRPIRKAANV